MAAERAYPRMAYHNEWPRIDGQVIRSIGQDMALGAGWDDPYGVRSAVGDAVGCVDGLGISVDEIIESHIEPKPERKKPGRPKKVTG